MVEHLYDIGEVDAVSADVLPVLAVIPLELHSSIVYTFRPYVKPACLWRKVANFAQRCLGQIDTGPDLWDSDHSLKLGEAIYDSAHGAGVVTLEAGGRRRRRCPTG